VRILADSACDLPLSYYDDHDVVLLPLKVNLDGEEYLDQKTISPSTVFDAIRNGQVPKTSQVSPATYKEAFTSLAQKKEQGLYIAFSSELSGTYQTAVMISEQVKEEYPDFDLTIINSKCASIGCGLIIKEIVKLRDQGATLEELISAAEYLCKHMEHLFTVEDLDYLAKGGRVSKASAFVGGLLNIKPLLHVEDGKLVPLEKLRGKKKLLKRMLELMEERGDQLEKQVIGIVHGDDEANAIEVKEMIKEKFQPIDVEIYSIGATIGSHTGTGTIGIFFLNQLKA